MRDKRQAVLSWVVVVLVVVALIFPVWALIKYLRLPPDDLTGHIAEPAPTAAIAKEEAVAEATAPAAVETLPSATATMQVPPVMEVTHLPELTVVSAALAAEAATATSVPQPAAMADLPLDSEPPAEEMAPYRVQIGSPSYLPAFHHADQGCSWLGAAGQVFDAGGASLSGLAVFISGELEGQPVNAVMVTGSHAEYGPGGYELFLSDHLPSAPTSLTVQLYDLDGQELSEPYSFTLPNECGQNLMLVNFQANFEAKKIFMPLTFSQ